MSEVIVYSETVLFFFFSIRYVIMRSRSFVPLIVSFVTFIYLLSVTCTCSLLFLKNRLRLLVLIQTLQYLYHQYFLISCTRSVSIWTFSKVLFLLDFMVYIDNIQGSTLNRPTFLFNLLTITVQSDLLPP